MLTTRHLTNADVPAQREPCSSGAPDLESRWDGCDSPECQLWLAARLSATPEDRRAVISCLTEYIRSAGHDNRDTDGAVRRAVGAAEAWTRAQAGPGELLAAERDAQDAAENAAALAAEEAVRARLLFRAAPHARLASFGTGRALGALAEWRAADRAWRLAAAAAWAARAAGQASQAGSTAGVSPETWAACVGESAGYAASSLARTPAGRPDHRKARKSARLIRRRLPRPRLSRPRLD